MGAKNIHLYLRFFEDSTGAKGFVHKSPFALTADVTTIDLEKCLEIGMNDYISKPIDEKLLYSKIIKCLQKDQ